MCHKKQMFLSYYLFYLSGLAVSPNDHTVIILKKSGSKWEKEAVLEEVSLLDAGYFVLLDAGYFMLLEAG